MRRVPMRRVPKHRGTGREEQSAEVPEEPSAELSAEEPRGTRLRGRTQQPYLLGAASGVLYGVRQRAK